MSDDQGRVLFDTFIYTTTPSFVGIEGADESPVYIIDIDKSLVSHLQLHLKRYKLRSKFQIHKIPESHLQLFSVWPSLPSSSSANNTTITSSFSITDPRSPHLGSRLLASTPPATPLHPEIIYHLRRTLHGVPEGPLEILEGQALPAESNLDVMNGVDYSKGCYVGQELTSRTYHTGVIRKRLLPLSVFTKDMQEPETLSYSPMAEVDLPPSGTGLSVEGEKRSPGKWLRGWGNLGWGLCRLDYVGRVLRCEWEGKEVFVKPFLPEWADREKDTGSVEQ
jgi:transferase CAF17, mitochondrial